MLIRKVFPTFAMIASAFAQVPDRIDFKRDVQPLLKQYCVDCHGPSRQMGHFRLDRRRDAMRGGNIAVIAPGSSSGSRLFHKITGTKYGTRMPPTGPLSAAQVDVFKRWLDQGAVWPDELAGDVPPAPSDPATIRILDAIRNGDHASLRSQLRANAKAVNGRGPDGVTPLMYAALYSDAATVKALLDAGADPKTQNDAAATALMWAVANPESTRLLLEAGAPIHVKSSDGHTALSIAAGRAGASAVVRLLLARGAKLADSESSPMNAAAALGEESTLRLLLDSGQHNGASPLSAAARFECQPCVDRLVPTAKKADFDRAAASAARMGRFSRLLQFLDRGASPSFSDPDGFSLLMISANHEEPSLDLVKTLLDRGADRMAKNKEGATALDLALRNGDSPVAKFLKEAGVPAAPPAAAPAGKVKPADSPRMAFDRALPLLRRADEIFLRQSGCVSCHHNSLFAMTLSAARKFDRSVDDEPFRRHRAAIGPYIESWRERALQGIGIPGGQDTVGYILLGLAAAGYPSDPATDALAYYLLGRQRPAGNWLVGTKRPPIESSDIQVTAAAMRALEVYAPKGKRAEYHDAVRRATEWLANAKPSTTEDRVFQLLGLAWGNAGKTVVAGKARELIAAQRPDGGWGQIASLPSDAYATGQALVALHDCGAWKSGGAAIARGVRFLMNTQFEDGSWYVRSRAIPFQPYFETGFPFGDDQWIAAAASNWAAMALAYASGEKLPLSQLGQ